MKSIAVNVSEPIYRDFQTFAQQLHRDASDLIGEALELYRETYIHRQTTLREIHPVSVGGPIQPFSADDDLLREMLNDSRD